MQTGSLSPVEQKQRITIIDILRGWALTWRGTHELRRLFLYGVGLECV